MRILFLGKNTKKPKAISFNVLLLIIFLFLCLNITLAYFYIEYKKNILIESYENNQISSHIYSNKGDLDYEYNLRIYADQMGELYSRIMRIDSQTERLQKILKNQMIGKDKVPKLNKKKEKSAVEFSKDNLTNSKFKKEITKLMAKIEVREELYNTMESILLKESVLKDTLPSLKPVNIPCCSSRYGWRNDPILGVRKFHEGIDFSAAHGEPIRATASGIVIEAGHAVHYGKHVRIKHGGGFETRYAHASKLLVKKGDLVSKGEVIALVGNTGRSTGPHLHYEIRLKGNSLDPRKYLKN
ncbi:M23 family metallopeptidase [Methylophilaceae bacterium]|jgi:murein DD-endopeptidase MepM/ murein hydrolase activator NlpD|nr:M23 family metallopeptidase [Methylophilaceae bacterium]